jgi:hypothetical protein
MNFKIYYFSNGHKVYLDGSASVGYSIETATMFARENASAMPNQRIYVENGDTMQDDKSYINIAGIIHHTLH